MGFFSGIKKVVKGFLDPNAEERKRQLADAKRQADIQENLNIHQTQAQQFQFQAQQDQIKAQEAYNQALNQQQAQEGPAEVVLGDGSSTKRRKSSFFLG